MSKKYSIIKIIVLFIYLFSYIKADGCYSVIYNYNQGYTETSKISMNKEQSYYVEFGSDSTIIPFYIKVQVTSDSKNPAPLLCYSNSDQQCKNNRGQLVKNPNGKTVFFWVRKEEFSDTNKKLYFLIECEENDCSYTIRVEGKDAAYFRPNFSYSYLVNENNKEMLFEIEGIENNNDFMIIAIDGSTNVENLQLNIDNYYKEDQKYKTGLVSKISLNSNEIITSTLMQFSIKNAKENDYLTLSVHLVNITDDKGIAENGLVLPNGGEITGILDLYLNEECFPIDLSNTKYSSMNKLYITGKIHTKYGQFYLEDENKQIIKEKKEIIDGQLGYVMDNNGKMNYLCFALSNDQSLTEKLTFFTFSVTEPNSLSLLYNYYPPQLTGEIYRRIIPKGKILFFSGTKNDPTAIKYDYNIYQIKGAPKMYIGECLEYPNCHYTKESLSKLQDAKNMNKMTIWTTYVDSSSVLDSKKNVIVVQCLDDDIDDNGYCEFETSIISKGQNITLIEKEKFSKYVINGERGIFIAELQHKKAQRLTFDIMIYSGDVTFTVSDPNNDINYDMYYLSNKVLIYINLYQIPIEKLIINYSAEINSFFSIHYNVSELTYNSENEVIYSGESYLVQIDPTLTTKTKEIFLFNTFHKNIENFLSNFYELNCHYEVKRGETTIDFFDGYAQEIINSTYKDFYSPCYNYTIKITEPDISNYNHKMCMLYVAGYESEIEYDKEREIIISENINQQVIFNQNFKKIRFLYPLSNPTKDIALYINVIDKAYYKVIVYFGDRAFSQKTITRSQIIEYKGSVIINGCDKDTLCPIIVEVEYFLEIVKTDPMIEITVREIKNSPSYLLKGHAKLDFVWGDNYYYLYTDIGKSEYAEITINFLREFGYLWAKVVKKVNPTVEDHPNWRGIYRMPSEEWGDSLPFDEYSKKLIVNPEDTSDCLEGCYLLISIQISQIGEYVKDSKYYLFSIITRITPSNRGYMDIPKIVIQADEFIIGTVYVAENEKIFEFYEIWLPHDSDLVLFDWQSSVAGLYINLGGIRPTIKNADFKLLPPGKDCILNLTKKEILDKANIKKIKIPNEDSLQDINLVIGVWTDKTDSIEKELYSLRVHQPDSDIENNLDITEINTDQKILCKPTKISQNEYRCLFVATYDDVDVQLYTPLLAYGASLHNGAINYIYANYIDRKIYDEFLRQDLITNIPTFETAELNSRTEGVNYIYTSSLRKGKYMYINVMTDKEDPIMIVTSMPVYNYLSYDFFEFYPNSFTEQLLYVLEGQLRLSFPGTDSVSVNIEVLNGHGEISWKNDPNKIIVLRGAGTRISLSSGKTIDDLVIKKLSDKNGLKGMENPGFVFYISYFEIFNEVKFNEVNYGKSLEIAYKDVDLPVFLYSKIGSQLRDINIAITFKDNEIDLWGIYKSSPLKISAILVKESVIYAAKENPDLRPTEKYVIGHYDIALKTAQIFFSEEIIKNYGIKESDIPTIYIQIEKDSDDELSDKIYEKFSVDAEVSGVNDGVIPVEKVYHYGRVRNTAWEYTTYRLKTDKNRPFMRIQIAFNSNNLNFAISESENELKNTTFKFEEARGKKYINLEINKNKELYYLHIFKRENTRSEEYLNNYAFKYINAKDESEILDYPISVSPNISISEYKAKDNETVINCTFHKLAVERGKANITYFFKVVENSTYYYGEDCNTIAVTESPYYTVYERNPIDNNGEITLSAKGSLSNWICVNVIAQVQENNVLEYISYNGIINEKMKPPEPDSNNSNKLAIFIIIGSILFVLVVGLIILIVVFYIRNKNLLSKVQHVSFQKTNNQTDPNLLLQKPTQINE